MAKKPLKKPESHSDRLPVPLRCKSSQKPSRGKADFFQRFPNSTQLSLQPEMYSGQDFPRKANAIQPGPQPSLSGSKQLSKWSSLSLRTSGNTGKPPLDQPQLLRGLATTGRLECDKGSVRGFPAFPSGNQTSKSPKLAFAAAIIAASLQFFALPGLTTEHQQNLTQQGSTSNLEIVRELDPLCNDLTQELQKLNESKMWIIDLIGAASAFAAAVGVLCINSDVKNLRNKVNTILVENKNSSNTMADALVHLGESLRK